jgi:hypothetical protein
MMTTDATVADAEPDEVLECCPCDQCKIRKRCGRERLACLAYSMFLEGEPQARWLAAPRTPSRHTFDAILAVREPPPALNWVILTG